MIVFRILQLIPTAIIILFVVSIMSRLVPGDPVERILGDRASAEQVEEMRHQLGLDKNPFRQFTDYLNGLVRGDLGSSIVYQKPVADMIKERIRPSVELALLSLILSLLISLPLGVFSAIHQDQSTDYISRLFSIIGVAIPNFWLATLFIYFFSLKLNWFPVSERGGLDSYVLPALTIATSLCAYTTRMVRNTILDKKSEDFVRTAYAKGLTTRDVFRKHLLINAAIPVLTIVGLQLGVLLTGSIVTEIIFDWPGLGTLLYNAIFERDYPVIQACVLLFAGCYFFANLLTDLSYKLVDPRMDRA